jgi:choline dehydrogenase-like flavoprotein
MQCARSKGHDHVIASASAWRGATGPLGTEFAKTRDPLFDAWMEAGSAAGFPATADYNGIEPGGFGRAQFNIRDGRRASSARSYLRPGKDTAPKSPRSHESATANSNQDHRDDADHRHADGNSVGAANTLLRSKGHSHRRKTSAARHKRVRIWWKNYPGGRVISSIIKSEC